MRVDIKWVLDTKLLNFLAFNPNATEKQVYECLLSQLDNCTSKQDNAAYRKELMRRLASLT